ncbi:MAG: type III-B CRISPR module RAMP protein Cmr6, partial [Thermoflexales bacterium]|nr:type III-B CRISPR module RAMP protein Cmr6 [Thermoflexales bacterium]
MGKARQTSPPAQARQQDKAILYPLPQQTRQAFERLHQQSVPLNLSLVFDRFAPDWQQDSTLKRQALATLCSKAHLVQPEHLEALRWRWQLCVEAAHGKPFALATEWCFVAGLGRKGSLEVGFTFNRHGIPVLPGSSVKGLARAAARYAGVAETDPDFLAIFGRASDAREDDAQAGEAIFFDAIPHQVKLELDVMNPHFPNYYRGDAPPTNWQSPVPVYFLTVAPKIPFWFAVGWRGVCDARAERLRNQAEDWLRLGLTELGAGAKTNAGYGFFTPAPP